MSGCLRDVIFYEQSFSLLFTSASLVSLLILFIFFGTKVTDKTFAMIVVVLYNNTIKNRITHKVCGRCVCALQFSKAIDANGIKAQLVGFMLPHNLDLTVLVKPK